MTDNWTEQDEDQQQVDRGDAEVERELNARYIEIRDQLRQGDRPFILNFNGESMVISERGARMLARTIYDVLEEEP